MIASAAKMDGLNVDEIFNDFVKKEIKGVIEERLSSPIYKFWIEHGSKKGVNFMGEIYRVLYCNEDDENTLTSLVLKIPPKHPGRRKKFNSRNMFLREITMYDEVIAYFNEFQRSKGVVASEDGFNESIKCYHSAQEELSESLFLEDLKPRGFEMVSLRNEPLTFDHMSLCLKAMGKLHAISFAIKDQQPQKFQELTKPIFEQYWTYLKTSFNRFYTAMLDSLISILKDENRLDLYEKVKRALGEDYFAKVFELSSGASAEPYAVLCHGDVTTNNVMFRKNDQGKPIEIRMYDWQFSRYASPVTDIVLFLLCSSSKELRDQHYDDFLKIYHGSLSELLKRLGSDPQKIFPYEVFLEQMQKYAIYAIFFGTKLFPILFADIDTMINPDDITENTTPDEYMRVTEHSKKVYNKRIVEFFEDMYRFGYI